MIKYTHVCEEISTIYEAAISRVLGESEKLNNREKIAFLLGQEKARADYFVLDIMKMYYGEDKDNDKS